MGLDVDMEFMATDRMYLFLYGLFKIAVSNSEYSVEIGPIDTKALHK
jgi:hypothetical protein